MPEPEQLPIAVTSQETSYNKLHCSFCRNPEKWQCVEEDGNKGNMIGFDVKLSNSLPLPLRARLGSHNIHAPHHGFCC